MKDWFYAHKGEQKGPVSAAELAGLAQSGLFLPESDLVWRDGMGDWKKAAEIPELTNLFTGQSAGAAATPSASTPASNDPYQPPTASNYQAPSADGADDPVEIEPGSSPLGITECISRGFDLTKRYFGIIFAVWVIYIGISFAVMMVFGLLSNAVGGTGGPSVFEPDFAQPGYTPPPSNSSPAAAVLGLVQQVVSQLVSVFLTFGMIRVALNIMGGKRAEVGMMFGEGPKLVKGFFATLLYGIIVGVGFLLLIVPGIYFALKYSQMQAAIVDKDMGIWESFQYSAELTQNNKMALFGLGILCFLINIGGAIACGVGLLFTAPLTWLAWLIGYRWLKYGPASLEDRGLLRAGVHSH